MRQDSLVIAREIKLVTERSLNLLSQSIKGRATHEIGRKLTGRLLGADNLADCFSLSLKGPADE